MKSLSGSHALGFFLFKLLLASVFTSFMVHCKVTRSFTNKTITSLGLLHDVLPLDFPFSLSSSPTKEPHCQMF